LNKYLEKIAEVKKAPPVGFLKGLKKGWARSSTTSKIGLLASSVGLGTGIANYRHNLRMNETRRHNEELSLQQLRAINRALKKPQEVVVTLSPGT